MHMHPTRMKVAISVCGGAEPVGWPRRCVMLRNRAGASSSGRETAQTASGGAENVSDDTISAYETR